MNKGVSAKIGHLKIKQLVLQAMQLCYVGPTQSNAFNAWIVFLLLMGMIHEPNRYPLSLSLSPIPTYTHRQSSVSFTPSTDPPPPPSRNCMASSTTRRPTSPPPSRLGQQAEQRQRQQRWGSGEGALLPPPPPLPGLWGRETMVILGSRQLVMVEVGVVAVGCGVGGLSGRPTARSAA